MIRVKNPNYVDKLPDEYQEVEYLESTGTQYMDTGVNGTAKGTFEMKFNMLGTTNVNYEQYFAGDKDNTTTVKIYHNKGDNSVQVARTNESAGFFTADANIHIVQVSENSVYIDGVKKSDYVPGAWGTLSYYIFSSHGEPDLKSSMKLYYLKMYSDDILVRDYVPCYRKSDNVAGLYDLVNDVFYSNAGTGVFLRGNEINKRDVNINPILGDKPLIRRYAGDKLVYGKEPIKYEQLVNYTMLYDNGDECTDVTGGWSGTTYYTNANFTKYDNYMHMHSYRALGYTNNKIDLSNYNKIFANTYTLGRSATNPNSSQTFILSSSNSLKTGSFSSEVGRPGSFNVNNSNADKYLFTCEIADKLKGNYYLGLRSDDDAYKGYINLYNLALIKSDDWQTLANIAGITASSIDDILTNSDTLLSNKEAVDFMIYQCTGDFMVSAVTNETFLTALNNSAYNTIIQANEHWNKFLSMVA